MKDTLLAELLGNRRRPGLQTFSLMTTQEHLNKILEKCRAFLEIAEKRTPGEWYESQHKSAVYSRHTKCSQVSYTGGGKNEDAAFIAACAGPAEAMARSTIAACEIALEILRFKTPPNDITRRFIDSLITAWLEELLC